MQWKVHLLDRKICNFVFYKEFFSSFTSKGIKKRNWQYYQNDETGVTQAPLISVNICTYIKQLYYKRI